MRKILRNHHCVTTDSLETECSIQQGSRIMDFETINALETGLLKNCEIFNCVVREIWW